MAFPVVGTDHKYSNPAFTKKTFGLEGSER